MILMELCNFVFSIRVMMKILFVKGGAMMGNLRQRIEKLEGTIKSRQLELASAPDWAVRCISAEQEFQKLLNGMKKKYCGGELTPLLTRDEILKMAEELATSMDRKKSTSRLSSNTKEGRKGRNCLMR